MKTLIDNIGNEVFNFYKEFLDAAPVIIIGIIVSILYFWISKLFRKRISNYLKAKAIDPLQVNFLSDIFKIINGIIGVLLFLYIVGKQNIVASILGAGAISAFVIGFVLKT